MPMLRAVGWQDRDWAKLDEDELGTLYGLTPRSAVRTRVVVWGAVVVFGLAVGAFAATHRTIGSQAAVAPLVRHSPLVFGDAPPATDPSVDPRAPGGSQTACTDESLDTSTSSWTCTGWQILQAGQSRAAPVDPGGACGVRTVDQSSGRWVCLSRTPPPPQTLPPSTPVPAPPDPGV